MRQVRRVVLIGVLGYGVLWLAGTSAVNAAAWASAGDKAPAPESSIRNLTQVDGKVWRGGAPGPEGYRELYSIGVRTVVDLRADHYITAADLAMPGQAGLQSVRLPIRDGQTPTPKQVDRFAAIVRDSDGPVFVHCGAGVGRTGSMTAAYLVRTGQTSAAEATKRNLTVGKPTLEQIAYMRGLHGDDASQPSLPIRAVSRLVDAPRRIKSRLRH